MKNEGNNILDSVKGWVQYGLRESVGIRGWLSPVGDYP
jgi:hypothetical protein